MKRMTPNRVALFIGVMSAVALFLYLPRYAREQQQAQAAVQQERAEQGAAQARAETQAREQAAAQAQQMAAQKAAEQRQAALQAQQTAAREKAQAQQAAEQQAAAQRAQYMARYLNPGFARKSGLKNVAIAAGTADGQPDPPLAAALASRFRNQNLALFTGFFKPSFYADGLFANVFGGSFDSVGKLQLTNTLDALLLAKETVQYSESGPELDNVMTAHVRLDVAFVPLDVMRQEQTWSLTADGAGFSRIEARKNAEDRLFKQISNDSTTSLVPLSTDNQ